MLELNNVYLMDCMEGMKEIPDKYFDLAIDKQRYVWYNYIEVGI